VSESCECMIIISDRLQTGKTKIHQSATKWLRRRETKNPKRDRFSHLEGTVRDRIGK
jgi:hypothetical protein